MKSKTQNLQFFEDIYAKRQYAANRFLYFLLQCKMAAQNSRAIALFYILALASFAAYICSFLKGRLSFLELFLFFILSLQVILVVGFWLLYHLALFFAKRFSMKLYMGIRDAAIFFIPFNVFALRAAIKNNLYLAGSFILTEAVLILLYELIIAPKKQHDLDIPKIMDADNPIDVVVSDGAVFIKGQISGESRNCLAINAGKKARFRLKEKAQSLHFAIGAQELIENCRNDLKISLYVKDARLKEPVLLFAKVINTKESYEERGWQDVKIGMDWKRVDFSTHEFFAEAGPGSRLYLSEPRIKRENRPARKIVFVVFDAVRHDHLGCYGYQKNTSPYIDAFAKEAVMFRNAIVQGEWTLTSFMSFLTSLYPSSHGVFHPTLYQYLDPTIVTLPQLLRENGFLTRCYFTHKRLVSNFGFARGFDSHVFRQCDKENKIATSDDVLAYGMDMLDFHKHDDLFLMLHFFDTHQPCNPPSPYTDEYDKTYDKKVVKNVRMFLLKNKIEGIKEREVQNLIARFDAEILRQDKRFGALINHMKSAGIYDDALIIFAADHGILLGDHKDLATIQLFDESLRVPLIVKFPQGDDFLKGRIVEDRLVEANIDIMPTILDAYGLNRPANMQGESLFSLSQNKTAKMPRRDFSISESFFDNTYTVSLRNLRYRYVAKADFIFSSFKNIDFKIKEEELYDIQDAVPAETKSKDKSAISKFRDAAHAHVVKAKERLKGVSRP